MHSEPRRLADNLRSIEETQDLREAQAELFEDRVGRQFAEYHAAHPDVYERLEEMTLRYFARDVRRGMKFFFEMLRHAKFENDPTNAEGFKLCNSYTSRYARLIEEKNPALVGYFRKRVLRGVIEP